MPMPVSEDSLFCLQVTSIASFPGPALAHRGLPDPKSRPEVAAFLTGRRFPQLLQNYSGLTEQLR